ncbi:MAG: transposase [Pirellulaceae bacterium]
MKSLRESDNYWGGGKFAYLSSDENLEAFVRNLASIQWVASIQPPPSETSRANEVVNYLTRYLTGGPISDHRITAADDRHVTFLARQGDKTGGERQQVPVTLKLDEFVRRWCQTFSPINDEDSLPWRLVGPAPRHLHGPLPRVVIPHF